MQTRAIDTMKRYGVKKKNQNERTKKRFCKTNCKCINALRTQRDAKNIYALMKMSE